MSQRERCKDLLDLDDDSPGRSAHDFLPVDAASRIEAGPHSLPRGFLGSSILRNAPGHPGLELDNDRVLVVEMERDRSVLLGSIVPAAGLLVLEALRRALARPRGLDALGLRNGILRSALDLDEDGPPGCVARSLLHVDHSLSTRAHRAHSVLLAFARALVWERHPDRSGNERHANGREEGAG